MTTSGTIGTTVIDTAKVIEHAVRRAGLPAASQTPETIDIAKENLFLILSGLSNRGITLWCMDKVIIGAIQNKLSYDMPAGTIDIWNANIRVSSAAVGTISTTSSTYTSVFSVDTSVISVGLLPQGTQTLTLVLETSQDGVIWATVGTYASASYTSGVWYWFDIDVPSSTLQFRIRESLGATVSFSDVFFSSQNTEVPLSRENRDTYTSFTNKMYPGRPTSFWYDRTVTPSIKLWPVPNISYYQIVIWRQRSVQDVGTLTQQLELPDRWLESVIWQLSVRLIMEVPGASAARLSLCQPFATQYTEEAEQGERDNSPVMFSPNISMYTK